MIPQVKMIPHILLKNKGREKLKGHQLQIKEFPGMTYIVEQSWVLRGLSTHDMEVM